MEATTDLVLLSKQEEEFCNLFVFGGSEYAGKAMQCFKEIFGETKSTNPYLAGKTLLAKPHIQARVKEFAQLYQSDDETIAVKLQVTETLKAVMEETATASYTDKWGAELSPAPLRAVSVNAAKALMELYPIKHAQENKIKIEGTNGNVIFNVIVPDHKLNNNES